MSFREDGEMDLQQQIHEYWEDPDTISLIDTNLRKLEEGVVNIYLEPNQEIIDIGCGDASSTLVYATQVKHCVGLERSEYLLGQAQKNLDKSGLANTVFITGDIAYLEQWRDTFNLAITQRVLINLTSWELQKQAIQNVRSVLRPGGIYIMIENTYEGHDAMNTLRAAVGLGKISKHWHNLYFHHEKLMDFLLSRFCLIRHHTFDLYYLLTRVYLNMFASFEGYGKDATKDSIFKIADQASRKLHECMGESVQIGDGPAFGPIQAFVLRRWDYGNRETCGKCKHMIRRTVWGVPFYCREKTDVDFFETSPDQQACEDDFESKEN